MIHEKQYGIRNSNGAAMQTNMKSNCVSIPIPSQGAGKLRKVRHVSSSDLFSSSDDSSSNSQTPTDESPPSYGYPRLSTSHHNFASEMDKIPLNIYSTSPRTSVMFHYYNQPKGSYMRHHQPLIRTKSTDRSNESVGDMNHHGSMNKSLNFDPVGCNNSVTSKGVLSGVANLHLNDDLRPRAWSESDKHRTNNPSSMHSSRMSALRKLKMKIAQKGGLKRQKSHEDEKRNISAASITSLEKVEEGRQLEYSALIKPNHLVKSERTPSQKTFGFVHQENETAKKSEHFGESVEPAVALPSVDEKFEQDLIYQRFLEEHTCYDLMPTSSKLVVFDTDLEVRKAFHALIENSLRCAPLWDSEAKEYVGIWTVSDFVNILLAYDKCPNKKLEDLENQKISCWRKVLQSKTAFYQLQPESSIFAALETLTNKNIHRLPIVNPFNGDICHVINHRRILHFLHLFMNELPRPSCMSKTLKQLGLGNDGKKACAISCSSPVIAALELLAREKLNCIPVLNEEGQVMDVFTKTDVLVLAREKLYYDLSIKVQDIITLHLCGSVDEEDSLPSVARMIPGSPALTRRKNRQAHHPTTPHNTPFNHQMHSTPNSFSNNPLLPALLQKNFTSPQPQHKSKTKDPPKLQPARQPQVDHGTLSQAILRNPGTPIVNRRRRHLSSSMSRSISVSSQLITCLMDDTLEHVVNMVVGSDVLQAVIVDEEEKPLDIISVDDILNILVLRVESLGNEERSKTVPQQCKTPASKSREVLNGKSDRSPLISINDPSANKTTLTSTVAAENNRDKRTLMSKGAVGNTVNNAISARPNSNDNNRHWARISMQASGSPVAAISAFKSGTSGQASVATGQTESARLLASGVQMKRS